MGKLKFGLLFLCAVSTAWLIADVRTAVLARNGVPPDLHSVARWTFSIVNLFALAGGAYGIHRRWPSVWKLGWAVIAFCSLAALRSVLSARLRVPQRDHPLIFCAAAITGDLLVTTYGSWWWMRRKAYFVQSLQSKRSFWAWEDE
jgi:hypothetical protein